MSTSSLLRKLLEEWLRDYEDIILAQRAEEAEKRSQSTPKLSHEDLCKRLDIQ